jgi:hypothetical protein
LKIGNVVIQTTGAVSTGSSFLGYFDSTVIVRAAGATGTLVGTTLWALGTYDVVTPKVGFLGGTTIDTTTAQTVKVGAQWNNTGNSVRLDVLAVEILNSDQVG